MVSLKIKKLWIDLKNIDIFTFYVIRQEIMPTVILQCRCQFQTVWYQTTTTTTITPVTWFLLTWRTWEFVLKNIIWTLLTCRTGNRIHISHIFSSSCIIIIIIILKIYFILFAPNYFFAHYYCNIIIYNPPVSILCKYIIMIMFPWQIKMFLYYVWYIIFSLRKFILV